MSKNVEISRIGSVFLLLFLIVLLGVNAQDAAGYGNIVMTQDPRLQDPFYREIDARAGGMPLASVNSVVHNVKHQSEGGFHIWDDLPSHRVRPGYTTTTKAPKIKTTTALWVRGRPRDGSSHHQPPWYQKFSDADGYDAGGGADYEEGPPQNHRGRGRKPTGGGRGRRPPAPMAPVRIKTEDLVDNPDGGSYDAGDGEGTKQGHEGVAQQEEEKSTTEKKPAVKTTTHAPEAKEKKEQKEDEGTKHTDQENGETNGEIDLASVKESGGVQHLKKETATKKGKGKKKEEEEEDKGDEKEEEDDEEEDTKKKGKDKKNKNGKENSEDEDEDGEKEKKEKKKGKKKGKKNKNKNKDDDDDDEDDEEKEGKKTSPKKKSKKNEKTDKKKSEEGSDEDEGENGELKKVEGEVKLPKAVDGDAEGHDEEDEDDDENEEEDHKKKSKKERKRKAKDSEEEGDDEEDDEDDSEGSEDSDEEENDHKKKSKKRCPPAHNQGAQNTHPYHGQNSHVPANQVPYPNRYPYGYTWPTTTTTTTTTPHPYAVRHRADDYHDFETMDCEMNEEDDEKEDDKKKKRKNKKSKKSKKKSKKNKRKKGGKHRSLDYLTSREKLDQIKRNRGQLVDELHAEQDLKRLRKTSQPSPGGVDCTTAVDEFPMKCDAWKSAGFCDTNQATQFLWCRKTCLCSKTTSTTTTTTERSRDFSEEADEE